MNFIKRQENNGILTSVFMAYFILLLHIFLIAGIGLLVLFFSMIANYMIWIMLSGISIIISSGYIFYRRMKKEGKSLKEMLKNPLFSGRSIEISLLGGIATFKLGRIVDMPLIEDQVLLPSFKQLESNETIRIRELTQLAGLLEKKLITLEEYNKVKDQIFNN